MTGILYVRVPIVAFTLVSFRCKQRTMFILSTHVFHWLVQQNRCVTTDASCFQFHQSCSVMHDVMEFHHYGQT